MNRIIAIAAFLIASSPLLAQAAWTQLYPTMSPPALSSGVMACHEATGALVLLGGSGTAGALTQAWRLQGSDWSQLPGPVPPSRSSARMVYDSLRERLVLFGGSGSGGLLQDTWEWDGQTWTSPLLLMQPSARSGHAMAFDRKRGVTVLYGGYQSPNNFYGDLWEWDGTVWQLMAPTNAPGPRLSSTMAFDPANENVLLHGGSVPVGTLSSIPTNDTWSWDGSSWQQHQPLTPPTLRFGPLMVCDTARGRVVLQGGSDSEAYAWEWDGQQWQMMLQSSPSMRNSHMLAYDAPNRRVVLFGGRWLGANFLLDDTWQYQTPLPADVVPYGTGCAGTAGTPELGNVSHSLPWLGDTVHHLASGIPAGEPGAVFVSSFTQLSPMSLAAIGMPGCDLLLSLDVAEFELAVAGVAEWTLAIPNTLALAGVPFYQQAFVLDGPANTLGLTASNGIEVTPGIR